MQRCAKCTEDSGIIGDPFSYILAFLLSFLLLCERFLISVGTLRCLSQA